MNAKGKPKWITRSKPSAVTPSASSSCSVSSSSLVRKRRSKVYQGRPVLDVLNARIDFWRDVEAVAAKRFKRMRLALRNPSDYRLTFFERKVREAKRRLAQAEAAKQRYMAGYRVTLKKGVVS